MNLNKLILTKNECYIKQVHIKPVGIMVHSTGANNPWLKRYVGPDDGKLGKNPYNNHWNTLRPSGSQVCVHGFIGKLADGSVATYQTLPWDIRGWHSGYYSKKSTTNANKMGYIGFEICEDSTNDRVYLQKVYSEAVELCAHLCKTFNLDPTKDGVIISHHEGNRRKLASNHADVEHWWTKHGFTMAQFRSDVAKLVGKVNLEVSAPVPVIWNPQQLWSSIKAYGLTDEGTAAVMSNIQAESGGRSNNLQNSYESRLGFTDEAYTAAVDSGRYTNFVKDKAGYGYCQWTFWSRKEGLLKMAKERKVSIGDSKLQLDYLFQELGRGYNALLTGLRSGHDVDQLTRDFMTQFERPASKDDKKAQASRVAYAKDFLRKFATSDVAAAKLPYKVRVTRTNLNIRTGPSSSTKSKGFIKAGVYTITEEKAGPGSTLWGKLKSGAGWIALDWVVKV